MKQIYILPIIAIFLVAFSVGDKLWSLAYLLKTIHALILMIITLFYFYIKNDKKRKNYKHTQNKQG